MQKRTKKLEIRMSESEAEQLKERFGEKQISTVVRDFLLTADLPRRSRKADPATLRELARIGNNLNQIARSLNASKGKALEKIEVLRSLAELRESLEAIPR